MKKQSVKFLYILLLIFGTVFLSAQNHSFSYSSPVCRNGANPTPSTSANFVSGGTFLSGTGLSLNSSTGLVNLLSSTPGTYTVTYTGAICSCFTNAPVSATIAILNTPTITIAGSSTLCNGSAITLTAGGATGYTWSAGAQTSTMTDFPFATVTSYTVLGADNNGCTSTAVKNVSLLPVPILNIAGDATVCAGYSFTMQAQSSIPATYTWSGSAQVASSGNLGTSSLTSSGTFTLRASAGGCTVIAVHAVAVIPLPTITILGSNTVCAGNRLTLFAQGAASYTWNTGIQADSLGIQPIGPTNYSVIGLDFNGCRSSSGILVNVLPKPTLSIIGNNQLCTGKTLALSGNGAISFTWSTNQQSQGINFSSPINTVVTVSGSNAQGCTNSASLGITVFPSPTIAVSDVTTCAGKQTTLVVEPSGSDISNMTFLWSPGGSTGASTSPSPIFTTQYSVTATQGPCNTRVAATVSVIPNSNPQVSFSYSNALCIGSAPALPNLSSNFTKGGEFYTSGGINVDPISGSVDLSGAPAGLYIVQYSVAPVGCISKGVNSAVVNLYKPIIISPLPNYYVIAPGEIVRISAGSGANSYQWGGSGLDCYNCQSPLASPLKTTVYCVGSSAPCVVGGCVMVDVVCERTGDFSVPNAFTPNNDGLNDQYCLKGWTECNKSFNIKIFNHWGEQVFESDLADFCWDGTFNGTLLPTGVYVYFISADFEKITGYRKSGNISLIR